MNAKITSTIAAVLFLTAITSCNKSTDQNTQSSVKKDTVTKSTVPLVEKVLTAEQQAALTPDAVLQSLKDGNKRFMNNQITARDHSAMVRNSANGQYPKAVILSCLDSRIPVEDVFDKGIGDVFVARVAGNIVNEDILGSMEYGCKVSGAKLILVLGHQSCGAIKSAIDDVKLGNITELLAKIKPAVTESGSFKGEKTSKDKEYVNEVGRNNVLNAIETIKTKSPVLKEMLDKKEIRIVGGYYDMQTGEVKFME